MLTRLRVRNFKRLGDVEVELGSSVVLIGPNNSGKTSALQALALWEAGLRRWNERRAGRDAPEKRPGVTLNRRDLVAMPVPDANLLWRSLHVRDVRRSEEGQRTENVRIDIVVEGVSRDKEWTCGLEFDYANAESIYCRPLRETPDGRTRMPVPEPAGGVRVAYLPPMSGLASNEVRLDAGAINVRIGEGRTAEVLRNLCHRLCQSDPQGWAELTERIERLFGVRLDPPVYVAERGEIEMRYRERGMVLDLSASGRGLQQTLLVLAFLMGNPQSVILLDEPDAHLEVLRQRQIYSELTTVARAAGSQIVAASHSEVLLQEAAERDVVVAFLGRPHRIDDRGSQLRKSLVEIGWEDYLQAETTGWVLFLEGSTDLAILQSLAKRLGHRAEKALERPFVSYVGSDVQQAARRFHGLREGAPHLQGIALFDRLERGLPSGLGLRALEWRRREIECYLTTPEALEEYARRSALAEAMGPLFALAETDQRVDAMRAAMRAVEEALRTLGKPSPWEGDLKVSDEFLPAVFEKYHAALDLPDLMRKASYHLLAECLPLEQIDPEVFEKLDAIADCAEAASPAALPE